MVLHGAVTLRRTAGQRRGAYDSQPATYDEGRQHSTSQGEGLLYGARVVVPSRRPPD